METEGNIKQLLNNKVNTYNNLQFIESDPISIPHQYTGKEDIEISAFLTSIIAWGRRVAIIDKANKWMELLDNSPADFVHNSSDKEMKKFEKFVYRTFNSDDCVFLMESMKYAYRERGGLENIFNNAFAKTGNIKESIGMLRSELLSVPHLIRSEKHIANTLSGSAAKRINMFLRWMIRKDNNGVDFGIWKKIPQSELMCPLDVHSGNVARRLGILQRKQNDWKAVEELTNKLRTYDKSDPVKYDFALFGMGVFEGVS